MFEALNRLLVSIGSTLGWFLTLVIPQKFSIPFLSKEIPVQTNSFYIRHFRRGC